MACVQTTLLSVVLMVFCVTTGVVIGHFLMGASWGKPESWVFRNDPGNPQDSHAQDDHHND